MSNSYSYQIRTAMIHLKLVLSNSRKPQACFPATLLNAEIKDRILIVFSNHRVEAKEQLRVGYFYFLFF